MQLSPSFKTKEERGAEAMGIKFMFTELSKDKKAISPEIISYG